MKANQSTKRAAALGLSALILSSVMLCSVACTRNDDKNPGDTTAGGNQTTTTPSTGNHNGSNTDRPLDPNAGTVAPDGDAGDPPTVTDQGPEGRGILPRFMH